MAGLLSEAAERSPSRLSDDAQARLLGLVVVLAGVAGLATALRPPLRARLHLVESLFTLPGVRLATGAAALLGLGLMIVGRGVMRRRRVAFWTAVVLLGASTIASVMKGLDVEEGALTLGLVGLLVARRSLFVVMPGPARFQAVAKVTAFVLVAELGYGILGMISHANNATPDLTPHRVLSEIASRAIGFSGPVIFSGRFGHWFPTSLTVLGSIGFAAIFAAALAPVALRGGGTASERDEVAALVDRASGDTLDPFILRRDKRYVFSPDRRAAIGYRYTHGVGLAAGSPVGDPECFPAAISAFLGLCRKLGWRPAVVGARGEHVPLYESFGLRAITIGDEGIVDIESFSLDGRKMRNVRQAMNHTIRNGITTEILREGDIDPPTRRTLLAIAQAHRNDRPEFGFFMALSDLLNGVHPDCVVVMARDRAGELVGFQRYVPCREGRALSLDRMRRLPGSVNGLSERMIVDVIEWGRARRFEEVSLNFAAFRAYLDEDAALDPVQSIEVWFVKRMEGRLGLQLDTLRRFNRKFQPRWLPRYAVYRSAFDIPNIGLAALSSEGFLPFDKKWRVVPERIEDPN